jgi:hypothetical protein
MIGFSAAYRLTWTLRTMCLTVFIEVGGREVLEKNIVK